MINDETIKALIEAGEKATQGEWRKHENAHSDVGYLDGIYIRGIWFWDNPETDFVIQAANSRPAIAALYAEVLELRAENARLRGRLSDDAAKM